MFKKIYIEITNICNLKCDFCPDTKRKKEFMQVNDFEQIVKSVKDYTKLIALHVKGEPLMHPQLEEMLMICQNYNLMVNITTNGTLLLKNREVLANSKALRQLNISLHSLTQNERIDEEEYLKNVFDAVDYIKEKNKIYISYRLWNLKNISENDENAFILKKLQDRYNFANLIEKAKENDFNELGNNIFLNQDIEFEWPNIEDDFISNTGTCQGLRNHIAILVNGDVVPCCLDQNGEIKLGNIFENSLEEILNFELSMNIKQGFEEGRVIHNLCQRCGYRTKFLRN